MTLPILPLQEKILRSTETSYEVAEKTSQYNEGVADTALEVVNPVVRTWEIRYSPLNLTDRGTLVAFLLGKGASGKFSYIDGCGGLTYAVRMKKDSFTMGRSNGKYIIKLTLEEQYPSEDQP